MYRVHCLLPRIDAERVSEVLSGMDPSPRLGGARWRKPRRCRGSLDAFCIEEDQANEAAAIIEREAPGARSGREAGRRRTGSRCRWPGLPAAAWTVRGGGWHELAHLEGGKIPVWIEAGPAFGTGHHGTTKGCLQSLSAEIRRKRPRTVPGYRQQDPRRAGAGGG